VDQIQELPLRGATFPVCIFGSGGHSVALIPFQHANWKRLLVCRSSAHRKWSQKFSV
jgi:hypothetical protein